MKIFIPSFRRAEAIKTHLFLGENTEYKIIVHTDMEAHQYYQNPTIPKDRIIVSGQPYSISAQRNWIKKNLFGNDPWACFMDDNVEAIHAVKETVYNEENLELLYPEPYQKSDVAFRKEFYDQPASVGRFLQILEELQNKADEISTGFAGFSANENYFFSRERKWKYYQLICSKVCIVKNDDLLWDERIKTMDDYSYSVQNMIKYGKVLVNAYVWPKAKHNQVGGLGTMAERGGKKIMDCKILNEQYPGLFRYKERKNSVPMGEIVLRGFGEKFFNNWKAGYEKAVN